MRVRRPACHYPLLLWTVCLLLFLAARASGQLLILTPSLSVSERYDDNIFQMPANKVDDFVTVVSPGVQLRYVPRRDTELHLEYRADFERFAQNVAQNQVAQRGVLRFVSPLTRLLSVNVQDTFVITEEPRDRLSEIDEVTGVRLVSEQIRQRTLSNRANGSLDVQLTPRTTLGLLVASLIDDVSVPDGVDEYRYTIGAELGYLVHTARKSRVSVSYDVTFHTFANNAPLARAKPADFEVHTAKTGARHNFSPTLSGTMALGYAVVTSVDPVLDGDAGIVANVGLTKTLRTGQASLNYRRSFISGGGGGGNVVVDTFAVSFSAGLTAKITAGLSSDLSFFDFRQATRNNRLAWTLRPSLVYQMFRFWSLSVASEYATTDFARADRADQHELRWTFMSQFALRERLFLNLTYRSTSRQFDEVTPRDRTQEFDRNEIMLTVTFAPPFFF